MCSSLCVDRFACFRLKTRFWFIAKRTLIDTLIALLIDTLIASLIDTLIASLIDTLIASHCPPFNTIGGFLCSLLSHKGRSSATSKQAASETFLHLIKDFYRLGGKSNTYLRYRRNECSETNQTNTHIKHMNIIINHPNKAAEIYKTNDATHGQAMVSVAMLQDCFPLATITIKRLK